MASGGDDALAWRHVYTRSRTGSLGSEGYQTVACAAEIEGRRCEALEVLAARARPPAGAEGRSSLLLQPLPTDLGRSVLTRVEPLGVKSDGRPGNYWAESLVVPDAWLEAGGWDLEAAFRAVRWWGSEDFEPAETGVRWIAAETQPPLQPGSPDRLADLVELVPEQDLRRSLFETLFWQSEGGGRKAGLFVVGAPETGPETLGKLVLLLPLLLPLERRTRSRDGRPRSLRLGTFWAPGALKDPDLLGVPGSELEAARQATGQVADLAGGVPCPAPGDDRARAWARRVDEALLAGRWDELLEEPGSGAGREPVQAVGAIEGGSVSEKRETDERGKNGDDPSPGSGDPLAERTALWRLRGDAETEAGELVRRLREDMEQLLVPVRQVVERERERFEREVERLRGEIAGLAEEGRRQLTKERDRGVEELEGESTRHQRTLGGKLDGLIESLNQHQRHVLDRLQEEEVRAETNLKKAVAAAFHRWKESRDRSLRQLAEVEPGLLAADDEAAGDQDLVPQKQDRGADVGTDRPAPWIHRLKRRIQAIPPWLKWGAPGGLLLLVAGFALWLTFGPWAGQPEKQEGKVGEEESRSDSPEPVDPLRTTALDRLSSGELAARLLRRAIEEPALGEAAAASYLALTLGSGAGLDETASCAMLQKVLDQRLGGQGGAGIVIDGDCGPSTLSTLATLATGLGCGQEHAQGWENGAACILSRHLSQERSVDCLPEWPFRRPCAWSSRDAERALESLRATAETTGAVRLAAYDLAADPDLALTLRDRALPEEEAELLLRLAHAAARTAAGEEVQGLASIASLTESDLQAVLRYLQGLPALDATAAAETEAADAA